jgi:hypothetical protein
VEFAPTFVWFFDAIPVGSDMDGGLRALDEYGNESDLARWSLVQTGSHWPAYRVEVDAVQLRAYLRASSQLLVTQHDAHFHGDSDVPGATASIHDGLRHLQYHALADPSLRTGSRSFARLLGKQVVLPLDGEPAAGVERLEKQGYPAFIVGVDVVSGKPIEKVCGPDLGRSYLTPVYFRREVLQRYADQPRKYHVTKSSLQCLHLWHLQIDVNPVGLVEVYLGDLGRDLPTSEWAHWKTYNVPPAGGMNESRFRRDFLAQFVSDDDPIAELHRAREATDIAFRKSYGVSLFSIPTRADELAFERLTFPTSDEPSGVESRILLLAKGLVDALNVSSLRKAIPSEAADAPSLALLEGMVTSLGGDGRTLVAPLRAIQAIRSSGIAHLKGQKFATIIERYGADAADVRTFERLLRDATASLVDFADLLQNGPPPG